METITPAYYGLPDNFAIKISELYSGGHSIELEALETIVRRTAANNFEMNLNNYLRLKDGLKYILGHG